jgi:hypothetical protein
MDDIRPYGTGHLRAVRYEPWTVAALFAPTTASSTKLVSRFAGRSLKLNVVSSWGAKPFFPSRCLDRFSRLVPKALLPSPSGRLHPLASKSVSPLCWGGLDRLSRL